jgi:putative ABC transport system substrate-binding protein
MNRRELIALASLAASWPLAARSQQGGGLRRIGVLIGFANNASAQTRVKAFQESLEKLGWSEGRNIAIEYRWTEGRNELVAAMAADLVRLKVEVIVAQGTLGSLAARQATSLIPIVFEGAGDPVGAGLVASLVRPGGNLTGTSNQGAELAGKRLELLREILPGLERVGILVNTGNAAAVLETRESEAAARALGIDAVRLEVKRMDEVAPAFDAFRGPALAVHVALDPLFLTNAIRINTLALGARLPAIHGARDAVDAGGLLSYGAHPVDLWRRTADYVDKILRGAKPADLPVEQPTKFELVVNLTTARALGLKIPETFLTRADDVIE